MKIHIDKNRFSHPNKAILNFVLLTLLGVEDCWLNAKVLAGNDNSRLPITTQVLPKMSRLLL